ncbi:MAG: HDOD domain-containing protein [Thermoleophilia bacterium]
MARQPIFDRRGRVVAYELLFRAGDADEAAPGGQRPDDDVASARVLVDCLMEIGLDRVVGGRRAYVNVGESFLVNRLALALPSERVTLEILETVHPTPDVLAALGELRAAGYEIALDDFVHDDETHAFLPHADVVKVEVMGRGDDELRELLGELRPFVTTLLAEKVETEADHARCLELGFDLFQGYFFARPAPVEGKTMRAGPLATLRLATVLQSSELDLDRIESEIHKDAALGYRLLRHLNSAFFSLPRPVRSIRDALVLLGETSVRRWATVVVLAGLTGKPPELMVLALVRARTCELVAGSTRGGSPEEAFVAGLLSVADALADAPIDETLAQLPLTPRLRAAILEGKGVEGQILRAVQAFERGDSVEGGLGTAVADAYVDALAWSADAAGSLRGDDEATAPGTATERPGPGRARPAA